LCRDQEDRDGRKRAEYLGIVEARATKKAAEMYDIPPERRNRITVRKIKREG